MVNISWSGGATDGKTNEVNWPTDFTNIGISRDNTLFNPTPRIPYSGTDASGSASSTLTAPSTPGTYIVRVYASVGSWASASRETDYQDITVKVEAAVTPTPTAEIVDYAVVAVQTRGPGFANPDPETTKTKIHVVVVRNDGTVADGPADVSLAVARENPTCAEPTVVALDPTSVTLAPRKRARIQFAVTYGNCTDPSPAPDYSMTGLVAAPGDTNPANDSQTETQDAR